MMKFLCAVFSYNRYDYLKNFVDSWREFFRHGDLLIVDDGSDESELVEYLNKLKGEKGIAVLQMVKQQVDGYMHGGLYHNMDLACDYAADRGYDYLYFTQDDSQFLWHDEEFVEKVDVYFNEIPKLCMIRNHFFSSANVRGEKKRIKDEGMYYSLGNTSMLDVGVVKPALIKKYDFKFGLGCEPSNAAWWKSKGYCAVYMKPPSYCFVPEPIVYRNKTCEGEAVDKPNKYFVEPFSSEKVNKLKSLPAGDVPIMEAWYQPWGWECSVPYFERAEENYYNQFFKKKRKVRFVKHIRLFEKYVPLYVRSRLRLLLS